MNTTKDFMQEWLTEPQSDLKSQDLMLGDWVYYDYHFAQVVSLGYDHVIVELEDCIIYTTADKLRPAVLSEALLITFGFHYDEESDSQLKGDPDLEGRFVSLKYNEYRDNWFCWQAEGEFKNLHELQHALRAAHFERVDEIINFDD